MWPDDVAAGEMALAACNTLPSIGGDEGVSVIQFCEVAEACLRGDSAARARLWNWIESDAPRDSGEVRMLSLFRLVEGST